eukprot:TRINITY_DN32805_c0_g1_i1.p1 TRINITY_DN32805_c0_g1~~TRINITY_DN32805_c0_g1_i1.p1  ORF type:complete len:738 (+),score=186.07 TRINITY_DN32805_c0_g1_i1:89-2302(+)
MHRSRRGLALPCLLAAALHAQPCSCGGDAKLWQLGSLVEKNPIITFSMFVFSVGLTIAIESGKHKLDHSTRDFWRKQALNAIWSELMILGVVAFALIVSAETGLTDVRITLGCDLNPPPPTSEDAAPSAAADSGSGSAAVASAAAGTALVSSSGSAASGSSSEEPCGIGFDLLIFEYAHMVLFFMGISYAVFMQSAFMNRNLLKTAIRRAQKEKSLADWNAEAGGAEAPLSRFAPILMTGTGWARMTMTLRAAMCVHLEAQLRDACNQQQTKLEQALATMREDLKVADLPGPSEAIAFFDMSRFAKAAMSIELVHLLHISKFAWCSVMVVAFVTGFLPKITALNLSTTMVIGCFLGPTIGLVAVLHLVRTFNALTSACLGHRKLTAMGWHATRGGGGSALDQYVVQMGTPESEDKVRWADGGKCPWAMLTGRRQNPERVHTAFQIIIISACFYLGELTMLSPLIADMQGHAVLLMLWAVTAFNLFVLIPRGIFLFALVHSTALPSRELLRYSCGAQWHDKGDHGHGHHSKSGCPLCSQKPQRTPMGSVSEGSGRRSPPSDKDPPWLQSLGSLSAAVTRGDTDSNIAALARRLFTGGAPTHLNIGGSSAPTVPRSPRRSPRKPSPRQQGVGPASTPNPLTLAPPSDVAITAPIDQDDWEELDGQRAPNLTVSSGLDPPARSPGRTSGRGARRASAPGVGVAPRRAHNTRARSVIKAPDAAEFNMPLIPDSPAAAERIS